MFGKMGPLCNITFSSGSTLLDIQAFLIIKLKEELKRFVKEKARYYGTLFQLSQ